jgi:hypothetical protein
MFWPTFAIATRIAFDETLAGDATGRFTVVGHHSKSTPFRKIIVPMARSRDQ